MEQKCHKLCNKVPPIKNNGKWIAVQRSADMTKSVAMAHECPKPDSESLVQDSQESWQLHNWYEALFLVPQYVVHRYFKLHYQSNEWIKNLETLRQKSE